MTTDRGLFRAAVDVPHGEVPMQLRAGRLVTQQVFGLESSMMYARRTGGYHSVPHRHNCEQVNLCIEGRMWIFVEDEGWELGPGDFLRVPRDSVHWAWNQRDEDAVLVEVHAPGLDILPPDQVAHLLTGEESARDVVATENHFLGDLDVTSVERRVTGAR